MEHVPPARYTIPISELAGHLFGGEPTESQKRSLRRAVRSLAAKGLIRTELKLEPVMVHDVVAGAGPGGSGYWKRDRGHRLGKARMNVIRRTNP